MSNNCKSNAKKEDVLKLIFGNLSSLAIILSILGFIFIWMYLRTIDKLYIFSQASFSSHGVLSIPFFFVMLFTALNLPSLIIKVLLSDKSDKSDFANFLRSKKILYITAHPIIISSFLSFMLLYSNVLDNVHYGYILFAVSFVLIRLLIYSSEISELFSKKLVLYFYIFFCYFISSSFFIIPTYIFIEMSNNSTSVFFWLVILYLIFLIAGNLIFFNLDIDIVKYLWGSFLFYVALFICLSMIGDEFKLQRMILKPIGVAQSPSESGGYLLKNGDFLELIERNKFEKYVNTINKRTYTYIHGYLILNVGNVRVICPHDFEKEDNQKLNDQKLDFSRCLSFTSEDIKFMKRGFPKNYKKADLSKKANDSKKVNNSKKTEKNKK